MKKLIVLILSLTIIFVAYQYLKQNNTVKLSNKLISNENELKTQAVTPHIAKEKNFPISKSIFVPYWNIPTREKLLEYDEILYFGISPNADGTIKKDEGYTGLDKFLNQNYDTSNVSLVVRMLSTDINTKILESSVAQEKIVSESVQIAKKYGFSKISLDLEVSVLPLEDVKNNISKFIDKYGKRVKEEEMIFSTILYGDLFYRARPYDLQSIEKSSDEILIMAYDFSKPRGEPGPNFPFDAGEIYSYDFKKMINDFTSVVPTEKLTVIFGMYGYDWTLGPQGLPLKKARAISLREIQSEIIPTCKNSCQISTEPYSLEKEIRYTDAENYKRVLKYEDFESVGVKSDYLKMEGITSVGYWVWGYF